jgi:ATP-binding cassette subfamily B protein
VPAADWSPLQIVTVLSLGIIVQAVASAGLAYAYSTVTARLTQGRIVPHLREELYAKLQHLSFGFFDHHGSNSIFNRVTSDAQHTRLFVDGVILQGITTLLTLGAYAFFMGRIHAGLTCACLSIAVPLAALTNHYSARLRPQYLRNRELSDRMVLLFTESVRGMQTVKGFAAEPQQVRRFQAANDEVSGQQRRIFWDLSLFSPLTQILSQSSLVVLFAYGGWLYLQGRIPLGGGLVVFAGLLQQFTAQVANLSTITNSVQQSLAAARRVFEVLDAPVEVAHKPAPVAPTAWPVGSSSRTSPSDTAPASPSSRTVVRDDAGADHRDLRPDGRGQEHAPEPDPAFYDPHRGRILADGTDLRDLDLRRLPSPGRHRPAGYLPVLQHRRGEHRVRPSGRHHGRDPRPRASRRPTSSSRRCRTGTTRSWVEFGVDLSGGQRQRLALARALLLQPSI